MLDLNAMAVFVQVVRSGSFSSASRHLAMPLSTVSRKVAELEASLNVRLLERSTRSLRLTEIGAMYYEHCRRGMEAFDTANRLLEDRQSEVAGRLRISLPPNLAEAVFVPILGEFQRRYPKARVAVWVSDRMLDLVEDGVDLGFRVGPLPDSNLLVRKLLSYRHVLVAAPAYLNEWGKPGSPEDLMHHRLLAFGFWGERDKQWTLYRGKQKNTLRFEPLVSINDYAAIQRAAQRGQGITELPSVLCAEALRRHALVEVLPEWRFETIDLQAVYTDNKHMSRLMRVFLDTCIEHIGVHADV